MPSNDVALQLLQLLDSDMTLPGNGDNPPSIASLEWFNDLIATAFKGINVLLSAESHGVDFQSLNFLGNNGFVTNIIGLLGTLIGH